MPCYVAPPSISSEDWLRKMLDEALDFLPQESRALQISADSSIFQCLEKRLCEVCGKLTQEQIMGIRGVDIYYGLYDWYVSHLLGDLSANLKYPEEVERYIKEGSRVGIEFGFDEMGCAYSQRSGGMRNVQLG